MKTIHNVKPGWLDQELLETWTEGGKILFSKEDKNRGCYWVVVQFKATVQLQRYFAITGQSYCSVDIDARGEQLGEALAKMLDKVIS
jgi:hypothetical protein